MVFLVVEIGVGEGIKERLASRRKDTEVEISLIRYLQDRKLEGKGESMSGTLYITHLVCFTQPIHHSIKGSRINFVVPRVQSCPLYGLKCREDQRSVRSGMKFVKMDGIVLPLDKYPFTKVST